MTVSIITAVFNNARHIASCLESVRSQTYPNIEHIIVDGGSTDGTLPLQSLVPRRWKDYNDKYAIRAVAVYG